MHCIFFLNIKGVKYSVWKWLIVDKIISIYCAVFLDAQPDVFLEFHFFLEVLPKIPSINDGDMSINQFTFRR